MKDTSELIELTLKNLSNKNINATPENYEKEFFSIAAKSSFVNDDIEEMHVILKNLSKSDKKNLKDFTYREIARTLSKRVKDEDLKYFLKHLSYFMLPSLSNEIKNEINNTCAEISSNPNDLLNMDTIRKLRRITNLRINDDKKVFNEKNSDVKKLMTFLSNFLRRRIDENLITIDEVDNIKEEIKSLKLSESSTNDFKRLYEKLTHAVDEFGHIVERNNANILNSKLESEKLYKQIEKLKQNLSKAEEEKSIDFLTKVLTRRAYSLEVEKIEKEYNAFDSKYALVFIDLDHFKDINDTYGHECGDSVLATFGSILNKLTRNEDIISRYGGEEFICIVHYKNILDIKNYVNRVKNIVSNNKFVHKDIKLDIKFSAGVTLRDNYESYEQMLNNADSLLYRAKNIGRNKIIIDDGEVI